MRATLIAEKVDGAGRYVRQIELCLRHCEIVIERVRRAASRFAIDGMNSVICLSGASWIALKVC